MLNRRQVSNFISLLDQTQYLTHGNESYMIIDISKMILTSINWTYCNNAVIINTHIASNILHILMLKTNNAQQYIGSKFP